MTFKSYFNQSGFSLLEVLVAVVVVSVGFLALASLQINLVRASSDSKSQTTALGLAKDMVEANRSFTSMAGYIDLDKSTSTTAIGGVSYTVTTDSGTNAAASLKRYVFDSKSGAYVPVGNTVSEAALSADTTYAYVLGRDFKRASVVASWLDASGATRTVSIEDVIDGLDPASSANVANALSSITPRKAEVIIFDPTSGVAGEGVIPIAIASDGSKSTAATNPKPIVDKSGNETRFDVLTYAALSNNNALAQARVETVVAACTCDTSQASNTNGYRPSYWTGSRYSPPVLATFTAAAGEPRDGQGKLTVSQSPYCAACCRDHHDPGSLSSSAVKFDPWRSGAHTHYGLDSVGALEAVGVNGRTQYNEACRLIRVDGIFRVAQDFNSEYFNLLRTNNSDGTPEYVPYNSKASGVTNAVTSYQNFVLAYLDTKVVSNATPSSYNNAVANATTDTWKTSTSAYKNSPVIGSTNIDDPTAGVGILRSADHKWVHARGLYVDHLEAEALAAIAAAKQSCITTCTDAEKQTAILSLMPFTTINVSELTDWSPLSGGGGHYVTVSDGGFYSNGAQTDLATPVRGYVTPGSCVPTTQATDTGTGETVSSNSGLVDRAKSFDPNKLNIPPKGIDPDEVAANQTDSQTFNFSGTSPGCGGKYLVEINGYDFSVAGSGVLLKGTNLLNCTSAGVATKPNWFSCDSSNPSSALTIEAHYYNYGVLGSSSGTIISCQGHSYSLTNTDKVFVCKDFALTTTLPASTPVPFNDGYATDSYPVAEATTNWAEYSTANVGVVAAFPSTTTFTKFSTPSITLNFTGPTTARLVWSCAYTPASGSGRTAVAERFVVAAGFKCD